VIHVASATAFHAHSGCADTWMTVTPPDAVIFCGAPGALTWHFTGDALVDVNVLVVQPRYNSEPTASIATTQMEVSAGVRQNFICGSGLVEETTPTLWLLPNATMRNARCAGNPSCHVRVRSRNAPALDHF
jgi:hypothetical protein